MRSRFVMVLAALAVIVGGYALWLRAPSPGAPAATTATTTSTSTKRDRIGYRLLSDDASVR